MIKLDSKVLSNKNNVGTNSNKCLRNYTFFQARKGNVEVDNWVIDYMLINEIKPLLSTEPWNVSNLIGVLCEEIIGSFSIHLKGHDIKSKIVWASIKDGMFL